MHRPQLETHAKPLHNQESPKEHQEEIPTVRPSQQDIHQLTQKAGCRRRIPTWPEQYVLQNKSRLDKLD